MVYTVCSNLFYVQVLENIWKIRYPPFPCFLYNLENPGYVLLEVHVEPCTLMWRICQMLLTQIFSLKILWAYVIKHIKRYMAITICMGNQEFISKY